LTVKLVRNDRYTGETSKSLLSNARKFLGDGIRIEIEYVDSIPRSPSGKLFFSISKVNPSSSLQSGH
jgi:hypothetical protein